MIDNYHNSPIEQFRNAMVEKGIEPPLEIIADGNFHRFSTNGKPKGKAGWYVLNEAEVSTGAFGDDRTGVKVKKWVADVGYALTNEDRERLNGLMTAAKTQSDKETIERQAKARNKAVWILGKSKKAQSNHPYLVRKNVQAHGIDVWNDLLVLPMTDGSGKVQSVQLISADGEKKFLKGGKMKGCYFPVGDFENPEVILVAEGYATAASVHEITGFPVVVAFNAGNLVSVSQTIRSKYPAAAIYMCADDDYKTKNNPGMTDAKLAAQLIGGEVIVPEFGENRPDKATDFNDMVAHVGKAAVTNFFTQYFSTRMDDMHIGIKPQEEVKSNYMAKPAASVLPSQEIITGTITEFGAAPYKFDKKNDQNFYVNVKNGDTLRTLWGVDLKAALEKSGLGVDDEAAIHDKGKVPVQIVRTIYDEEGNEVGKETRTVLKGSWFIEPLEDFVDTQVKVQTQKRDKPGQQQSPTVEKKTPVTDDGFRPMPEPSIKPQLHFSQNEFEAISKIWNVVPRRVSQHNESGYHIVQDEKRKVTVTRDKIELPHKARHRSDESYLAACEHARLFWGGEMEIAGNRQHCVKAYAYAHVYGIKVTNYQPNQKELLEIEKIVNFLRKDMEPAFRRPNGHGAVKQTAKLNA